MACNSLFEIASKKVKQHSRIRNLCVLFESRDDAVKSVFVIPTKPFGSVGLGEARRPCDGGKRGARRCACMHECPSNGVCTPQREWWSPARPDRQSR